MPETHQTFATVLEATGGNNVGIVVPGDVVAAFGRGKRVPVQVPAELSSALDSTPGASAAWEALSPSKQKAHVLSVTSAKTTQTRERRVAKVIETLAT